MWSLPAGCELRADGFGGEGSDEGLPMTTFFTRRTALGVAAAGALSALTACASWRHWLGFSVGGGDRLRDRLRNCVCECFGFSFCVCECFGCFGSSVFG